MEPEDRYSTAGAAASRGQLRCANSQTLAGHVVVLETKPPITDCKSGTVWRPFTDNSGSH